MWRRERAMVDRKSTRLNSSHLVISYAVFCLKKKKTGCDWPGARLGGQSADRGHGGLCSRGACRVRRRDFDALSVRCRLLVHSFFFFFNDTAPPEISPLPLHDALPI